MARLQGLFKAFLYFSLFPSSSSHKFFVFVFTLGDLLEKLLSHVSPRLPPDACLYLYGAKGPFSTPTLLIVFSGFVCLLAFCSRFRRRQEMQKQAPFCLLPGFDPSTFCQQGRKFINTS